MKNQDSDKEIIVIYINEVTDKKTLLYIHELEKKFAELDFNVITLNLDAENFYNNINDIYTKNVNMFIGFDGIGVDIKLENGDYLMNMFPAPYIGIFFQHPVYYHDKLSICINNYIALFQDEAHVAYAKRLYRNLTFSGALQMAELYKGDIQEFALRTKNLIFIEDYIVPESVLDEIDSIGNDNVTSVIYSVIKKMLNNLSLSVEWAFDEILRDNDIVITDENYCLYMKYMIFSQKYVYSYIKNIIIRSIVENGIVIDVYGKGWEKFESVGKANLVIHDSVSDEKIFEILNDTKIVLNINHHLKSAINEYMLIAMSAGAVYLTDTNEYIEKEFDGNREIYVYSLQEIYNLPSVIKDLLNNSDKIFNIAFNGCRKVNENYGWKNIVKNIIAVNDNIKDEIKEQIKYSYENINKANIKLYNVREIVINELVKYGENISYYGNNNLKRYYEFQRLAKRFINLCKNDNIMQLIDDIEERSKNELLMMAVESIIMKTFDGNTYEKKILEIICDQKYSYNMKLTVFWYLSSYNFLNNHVVDEDIERKMYELYSDIVEKIKSECRLKYNFRKKEVRNHNIAIVITTQFLGMNHGPTKTALDRCKVLIEDYGMDIVLINTGEILYNDMSVCLYDMGWASYVEAWRNISSIEYESCIIPFYQCPDKMPNINEIVKIAEFIYNLNPYFILSIGGNNITSDICSEFCTTLSLATVPSNITITVGQFQAIGRKLYEKDKKILRYFGKDDNHVIEGVFTSSLKKQSKHFERIELGIPKGKFVGICVGARLTSELDDELLEKLIYETNDNVVIVLAGKYENYDKKRNEIRDFESKFINLGFQDDMLAVLDCCDLYINPKRTGGGTSGVEAMYKGLPVVTLPIGDVGLGAGQNFHVNNYKEMIDEINRYSEDKDYYAKKSKIAKSRAAELMDTSKEFGKIINELIRRMD